MSLPFYIVDVFAEKKYAGNQLAVANCRAPLSSRVMQKIAAEMHFSETTFILSETPRDGGYDMRIFTPQTEVPFAGHPTLGTAYILREEIIKKPVRTVTLNLKVGQIPVRFAGNNLLWMKQNQPEFSEVLPYSCIADTLGIPREEIDTRFPVQVVSTGLPFAIIPLKKLDFLSKLEMTRDKFMKFSARASAGNILMFCPEVLDKRNRLHVRVFAYAAGVPEDPATGSGNGCLAGYLVKHRYFGPARISIRVEQGIEIGRPSLLHLKASESRGNISVQVGGKVIPIARGELV